MSDPRISALSASRDSTRAEILSGPFPLTRRGLTLAGAALVTLNVLLRMRGGGETAIPILLWGTAALCFFASFIVFMMDPQKIEAREPDAKKDAPPVLPPDAPGKPAPAQSSPLNGDDGEDAPQTPRQPPLIRRGNPLRPLRGGVIAAASGFLTFLLMAKEGQWRWGVPIGALLVLVTTFGVMDFVGSFDDPDDRVAASRAPRRVSRSLSMLALSFAGFFLTLMGGVSGQVLPPLGWGLLVTLAFIALATSFFEFGRALGVLEFDELGESRPLWKRHGFWLVLIAAGLYLPMMGTSSLWDPWETHYGEVAREILARDDWISLWWAQDGWFWSKPVLDMWMQAIAMASLGVHYQPDQMLIGSGTRPIMHPEWAVRTPIVLFSIVALYVLYKGTAKTFGRRAALLGGIVLASMPDWYLLTHQTMTDMTCVAPMAGCMGLVLLGLRAPESLEARVYEVKGGKWALRLSAWHIVLGSILVCVIPQILYLASRNVDLLWHADAHGFRPHWDEFHSGSGMGNCGLPGNEECRPSSPVTLPRSVQAVPTTLAASLARLFLGFEPVVQALVWTAVLGVILYLSWGERRLRRLYFLAAWFCAALATLGKEIEGFGLPVLVTFAYLAACRPGEEILARLLRFFREISQFEIVAGLLVILAVALPWHVAMYVRHGAPFTDRIIIHDMFNRAFNHVHDTNEGDDTSFRYYAWQLGYALFPWTGLSAFGLLWWMRRGSNEHEGPRTDTSILLCLWFVFGFSLFSYMGTKFHHYIVPAIAPLGILAGVVLDDMLGERELPRGAAIFRYLGGLFAGIALVVVGIACTQPGSFWGDKPDGHLAKARPVLAMLLIAVGGALTAASPLLFGSRVREPDLEEDDEKSAHTSRMLAGGAVAAALVLTVVSRDLILKPESSDQPGAIRLLQLFTYNYRRAWPDSLDFSAALTGFAVTATVIFAALAVRSVRQHVVAAALVFGVLWGVWGLDVYMQKTAQHWGQHEIIAAYYADRASSKEQLVAYQMNWKGENFYTGNHIPAFVSTGGPFTSWLKKQRDAGASVMYFITEAGRIGGLKNEVAAKSYREVSDKSLCNKFVLVRAEL